MVDQILEEIWRYSEEERIPFIERVFQTQLGGYGYGDQLAGVRIPILRKIAKKYKDIKLEAAETLLQDELHEARFVALVMLISKFKKNSTEVFDIYIRNTGNINNWDLVDISAPHIVGEFCLKMSIREPIWNLANSTDLWENRMAIVASWAFVKTNECDLTLDLCKHFMPHKHHLIHKATGWMLREVGKKNESSLINFLGEHKNNLSKITVSYAREMLRKSAIS